VARTIYRYQPINETPDKAIGILLPFNKSATGRSNEVSSYNDGEQSGKGVFESSYTTQEQSISNLVNLLLTAPGERFMQPKFGTNIRPFLFQQSNPTTQDEIEDSLTTSINTWLPYILINSIDAIINEHRIDIRISFRTSSTGANLVINVFANENTIAVSEVETDSSSLQNRRLEVFGGA